MSQSCTLSARVTDNPNALVHLVHVQETGTAPGADQQELYTGKEGKEGKKGEKKRRKREREAMIWYIHHHECIKYTIIFLKF